MEDREVSITLKIAQWNVVMQALGNMPFAQVASLIEEIKKQADSQLNATLETSENPS